MDRLRTFMVTPKYVLGADSFWIHAASPREALGKALAHISAEEWSNSNGWTIFEELGDFEDNEHNHGQLTGLNIIDRP